MIFNVTGGQVVGNRLKGTIVGPGGDWVLASKTDSPESTCASFKTVDGALIYVQFLGLAKRVYRVANS